VKSYYARRRAEGRRAKGGGRRPLTDGTLISEGVTLRAAIRWAISEKWLTQQDEPKIKVPPTPPPRDRWLTREEFDRLLAAAEAEHIKLFIIVALATAGRRGAVTRLRWDQVDFTTSLVDLGRGRGNKKRAIVPVTEYALSILRQARETAQTPYVLEWRGKPMKSVRTGFEAAVRRADLVGVTAHVLRHTAAAWMTMAGVPLREIARFLGDSEKTVEKIYGKHAPDYLRNASAALATKTGVPRKSGQTQGAQTAPTGQA
jgi:integrase